MADARYDVVIIGGGIIGTSIAYHLAKRGCSHVAVIEKEISTGMGSTAKAAGGIRAQFGSAINVDLSRISLEHFERFSAEMGVEVLFNQVGYLWIATRSAEMDVFRRNVDLQRRRGLDVRLLSPEEVAPLAPYVRMDDVLGGTFHARDGYAPPADYVQGYHKKAKELGVRFLLQTEVTAVLTQDGAIRGVRTHQGEIAAPIVVNAAGAGGGRIGRAAGIDIPIQPIRRQCFVTEPIRDGMNHPIPMTIDYTTGVYIHSESGGVLVGMANPLELPGFEEAVDPVFLERIVESAVHRVPLLEHTGIKTSWAGLYEVTPDNHPILGEAPGLKGFYCACGFSGHGVMHAPATGMILAELITTGKTSLDISCLSLSRFREGRPILESHVI